MAELKVLLYCVTVQVLLSATAVSDSCIYID